MEYAIMQRDQPRGMPALPSPMFRKPWLPPQFSFQQAMPIRPMALQHTATANMKVLKYDVLKSQLQSSVETRLPAWAAQTATPLVQQAQTQMMDPTVRSAAASYLYHSLSEAAQHAAASMEQLIEQAAQDATKYLGEEEARTHGEQVLLHLANENKHKASSVLNAEVASPKSNQKVQSSLEKAVENVLMESLAESVAVLSQSALQRSVETLLNNELFPKMLLMVQSAFDECTQQLLRDANVVPAAVPQACSITHAASVEACGEAMELSLREVTPVPVPVMVPIAPAVPVASMRSSSRLSASALHVAVPQQTKRATPVRAPVRAPVPRYAVERRHVPVQMDAVPDEMLLGVLEHVDPMHLLQCSLVCRRWHKLCRSEGLWRRKHIRYDPSSRESFVVALRTAPVLAMVDCEAMQASAETSDSEEKPSRCMVSDHDLLRLLHASCRIQALRLPTALDNAPPSLIVSLLEKHKATLEQLHLTSESGKADPSDLSQLLHTVDHLPKLKRLSLSGQFNVEFTFGPRLLGAPQRKIQDLDLSGYTSSSPHTACSMLRAYSSSLRTLALPRNAGRDLLACLSMCEGLVSLTAAVDFLAPAKNLPNVVKLTLTAPISCMGFGHQFCSPLRKPFGATCLSELVLDGVPSASAIPNIVRCAVFSIRALTLRRTGVDAFMPLLGEMPILESLTFDQVEDLTADNLRALTAAKPVLRYISISRSLRCSADTCWRPVTRYLHASWPRADVRVDVSCACTKSE